MDRTSQELLDTIGKLDIGTQTGLLKMLQNDHFRDEILACWSIYNRKGNDYTRGKGDADRLDNFKQAASEAGITLAQAWFVYAYKQWSAVVRFCKEGKVESEPIEERLHDIINYSLLLLLYIKQAKAGWKREQAMEAGYLATSKTDELPPTTAPSTPSPDPFFGHPKYR